jgi:hypothetical protein
MGRKLCSWLIPILSQTSIPSPAIFSRIWGSSRPLPRSPWSQWWVIAGSHEALAAGNVVAAICFAPITLARADVIRGKRVTAGYLNPKFLREAGGIYTDAPVERDGLIITANGPDASRAFGVEIALALAESPAVRGQ